MIRYAKYAMLLAVAATLYDDLPFDGGRVTDGSRAANGVQAPERLPRRAVGRHPDGGIIVPSYVDLEAQEREREREHHRQLEQERQQQLEQERQRQIELERELALERERAQRASEEEEQWRRRRAPPPPPPAPPPASESPAPSRPSPASAQSVQGASPNGGLSYPNRTGSARPAPSRTVDRSSGSPGYRKCTNADGSLVYTSRPCRGGATEELITAPDPERR